MYIKLLKSFLFCFIILCTSSAWNKIVSQNTISSLGADIVGIGGTVNFTIGQIAYNTFSSSIFSESQGVQQPYEISIITSILDLDVAEIYCTVFPNPTNDALIIHTKNPHDGRFFYKLYDIKGIQLLSNCINQEVTNLSLSTLPPAIYFINILDSESDKRPIFKTFKIIKI